MYDALARIHEMSPSLDVRKFCDMITRNIGLAVRLPHHVLPNEQSQCG